jgi:LEA14-like dessication related protein
MLRHRLLTLCLLPLAALLFPGCMSLNPDVSAQLADIRIVEASLFETTGEARVRLTNRSAQTVSIRGGTFTVSVNNTPVGDGVIAEPIRIPGLSTQDVRLRFSLGNSALLGGIGPALDRGIFTYRIDARLRLAGFGPALPVSTSGQIDLRMINNQLSFP